MSSHARSSRDGERRLSIRTLIYASVGSAAAAIVTSQFWIAGTPIAAALTPVIVALVSELLQRPTEKIAQRLTTQVHPLPETDVLPEAAGAGAPPKEEERAPRPARAEPGAGPLGRDEVPPAVARGEPVRRVYGTGQAAPLPWKAIVATGAIAFVLAAAALTLPELIAGESLGGSDRDTTLWGGGGGGGGEQAPVDDRQEPEPRQTEPAEPARPRPEEPERTVPTTPPEEKTTPTTPETTTTTAPAQPGGSPPEAP